jgi:ADP-ribose pyrophosphatase
LIPAHPLYAPIADEIGWDGRFPLQRVRFRYRRFDGSMSGTLNWELWRRGQGVMILPYDPRSDRVGLIEEFRLPALAAGFEPVVLSCAAGLLEPAEDPLEAARRETAEETGLAPDRLERIGKFMLMHGGCDETVHFHVARVPLPELGRGAPLGLESENESTRLLVLPAEEAFAMVADNRVMNAPTALSLLWLQLHRPRLQREWTE